MNQATITDIWGNSHCSWISLDTVGSFGGFLLCWNNRLFSMKDNFRGVFSLSAVIEDKDKGCAWIISSVYGSTDRSLQSSFWCELDSIRSKWAGPWCIGGDWNITRFPSERFGGGNTTVHMAAFFDWINSHSLMDLHLGGANFTWSNHQIPPSLSRLDRFLVTNDWMDPYPEVSQIALPKPTSDHCSILFDSKNSKWGPSPFRFELLWLEDKHFRDSIKIWWNSYDVSGRATYRLSSKLKRLKLSIKVWIKINHRPVESHKASILEEMQSLDIKEEN